ncbi:MAG: glycosyltransferase family 2 protein [Saprospiraceae bacterium]|nr:glycosyltransferase family 2 protein [Bacteroidia bacterium]NNL92416.1 glycosyltransferase family 2 protein [Saprospiraceae bacterium]
MSQVIFNIIFTPHTVRCLLPFAESIQRHNDVDIRLVSNNCSEKEDLQLKSKATNSECYHYYKVNTNKILQHHEVLNELYNIEEGHYFCFMDSDIFCNDCFLPFYLEKLEYSSAVFACKPILESPLSPEINKLQGRHFHDRNNRLIGGSYFAIYKRTAIEQAKQSLGFLFDRKDWNELNKNLQSKLEAKNMVYERYDTGKLLNFTILENGGQLDYHEHPNLFHIGGVSWNDSLIEQNAKKPSFPNNLLGDVLRRRQKVAKYFSDFIAHCLDNTEIPDVPQLSQSENEKLKEVSMALRKLYHS